ncbi:MAG: TssQ family T6SS-associated lipoprotein [Rhodocyclaceae bacterium]|nr:TssQ family T6SS-associated lipoprotein [Rhodocyclaceae bacterium]
MISRLRSALALSAMILLLSACVVAPQRPSPVVDQNKVWQTASLALDQGRQRYEQGDFEGATMWLDEALVLKLSSVGETVEAHKLLAFIACSRGNLSVCREHFRSVLALDSRFELAKAEAGHPMWGPVFIEEKAALAH